LLAVLTRGNFLLLVKLVMLASEVRFLMLSLLESCDVGRDPGVGGTGNAPMLVTFLTGLAEGMPDARPTDEDARGRSDVDADCGVGSAEGRVGVLNVFCVAVGRLFRAEVDRG
jgi:hypothetical protein